MLAARVLPKLDEATRVVSAQPRFADDDVADHHRVAVRGRRLRRIDQAHLAVLRVGDIIIEQLRVVRAALEVLSIQRIVDIAEPDRRTVSAQVEIVAVAVVKRGAVGADLRGLDHQVAVVVAHDTHVAHRDRAVGHGDVVARSHADAGAIVPVARVLEFQVLQSDIGGLDLKHRARVRHRAVHRQARGVEHRTDSAHATHDDWLRGRAGPGPTSDLVIGRRVDLHDIPRVERRQAADRMVGASRSNLIRCRQHTHLPN